MAANSVAVNLSRSLIWCPFKELYSFIENLIVRREQVSEAKLKSLLKTHCPDFVSLLKNSQRNATHREAVKKATHEGITVAGLSTPQTFDEATINEALLLSDLLNLNEIVALEHLLAGGQQQQALFPELARGPVAVLLYYDGKRALANSLRLLVQASQGRSWQMDLEPNVVAIITEFTRNLQRDHNMIAKLVNSLSAMDVAKEMDELQKNRALGPPRYRKMVVDIIEETYQSISDIIFCWACQSNFTKDEALSVLQCIKTKANTHAEGSLKSPFATLTMAMMYVCDVREPSEGADPTQGMLLQSKDLGVAIHRELFGTNSQGDASANWVVSGSWSVLALTWSVCLQAISEHQLALTTNISDDFRALLDDAEKCFDKAVAAHAFRHVDQLLLSSPILEKEEFFAKRLHSLVGDIIILMPLKIKEMRSNAEEVGRVLHAYTNDGLVPPVDLPRHFEEMLNAMSRLYSLRIAATSQLQDDFWIDSSAAKKVTSRQLSLSKFVRLYGDQPPPTLFIPYLNLLKSLSATPQSAHQCYNMLKNTNSTSIVSWEHFFYSLQTYYSNLRQDHVMIYQSSRPSISTVELEGLCAVLGLMSQVVKMDHSARMALADRVQQSPLNLLTSLVCCSVPTVLKAAFLNTLAAFASSADMALKVWQCIESAQFIPAQRLIVANNPQPGIQTDLEEVEARNEEFPITLAMLNLLDVLTDHPLPVMYGNNTTTFRNDFDRYMDYVRHVFLKFHMRSYKRSAEKWEIGAACLKIMEKILRKFSSVSDNVLYHATETSVVRPGVSGSQLAFNMLAHILQDSGLLRLILLILDEGTRQMESNATFDCPVSLESAVHLCLKVLLLTAIQQDYFLAQVRNSKDVALIVTSLDQLLLMVNPRTGRLDYLAVIAKYVTFVAMLPKQALTSARTLLLLCKIPRVSEHMAVTFDMEPQLGVRLMSGFAEALGVYGSDDPISGKDDDWNDSEVRTATAITVMRFLLQCIDFPVVNIGHYLLGFDPKRPITSTTLQEPGVLGSPRSCFHAVLALLDEFIEKPTSVAPSLVELSYKLVYTMASSTMMTQPVMRYLRTTRDFFSKHLERLPLPVRPNESASFLMQLSYYLKSLALELRFTASQNQRSHLQRLISLLTEETSLQGLVRRKVLSFLEYMDVKVEKPKADTFEAFDIKEIQRVIKECQFQNPGGPMQIDLIALCSRLSDEKFSDVVWPSGQRQIIAREMKKVMQYAIKENSYNELIHARNMCFFAWQQVIETAVTTCPSSIFGGGARARFLLEISEAVLKNLADDGFLSDVRGPSSGVVLILMSSLHQVLLESSPALTGAPSNAADSFELSVATYSSSLVSLAQLLLLCLLKTPGTMQQVRSNYYGAVVNVLQMAKLETQQRSEQERFREALLTVFVSNGEQLMESVCRDTCCGHEVTRMLALSTLTTLLSIDSKSEWLEYLSAKGYIRHMAESLLQDDTSIKMVFAKGSQNMRSLYLFESKLTLLMTIGETPIGAKLLLENNVVTKLTECGAIDLRPQRPVGANTTQFTNSQWLSPPLTKCYHRQVYEPTLRVLSAIQTSLGKDHKDALCQIHNFFAAHADTFSTVLQQANVTAPPETDSLEEVALTCQVLSLLKGDDDMVIMENEGRLRMLHCQMINLLPALVAQPKTTETSLDRQVLRTSIIESIVHHCAFVMASAMTERIPPQVLFSPNLLSTDGQHENVGVALSKPLRLSILVETLQSACHGIQRSTEERKTLDSRISSLPTMCSNELESLLPEDQRDSSIMLSPHRQREIVLQRLSRERDIRNKEIWLHTSIAEQTLFTLWKHLEFYISLGATDSSFLNQSNLSILDCNELRSSIQNVFSESFFRKIQSVEPLMQGDGSAATFFPAIIRRLKTLVRSK